MKTIPLIILLFLFLCFSCKPPVVEENKQDHVYYVDVDSITSIVDLKLSDLVDSVWLVALETSNKSLLGTSTYYVDKECILVFGDGLYKYSLDGTFNNKLMNRGRGPGEIPNMLKFAINDYNNLILIDGYPNSKNKLLAYNYKEETLSIIPKAIEGFWYSLGIVNDSVLIGVIHDRYQTDSIKHAYFYQNYKGELISTTPNSRKAFSVYPIGGGVVYQNAWISQGDNFNYVRFTATTDTLFKLVEGQLIPYLILRKNTPGKYPPTIGPEKIGDRSFGFPSVENPSYSILSEGIITNVEEVNPQGASDGVRISSLGYYYFLNKSTGKTYKINSYEDDFISKIQLSKGGRIKFPVVQTNGLIHVVYFPHELMQLTLDNESGRALPPNIYKQLEQLFQTMTENDNPVLLVGKIKDKIVI
jgi:hypothetical protein